MSEMSRIEIITSFSKFDALKAILSKYGVTGMTAVQCLGCGIQKGTQEYEAEVNVEMSLLPKWMVILYVKSDIVTELLDKIAKTLYTGHIGDGKIVVSEISNIIRVRTGEEGLEALY